MVHWYLFLELRRHRRRTRENPAKCVMMLMVTSFNMGWKLPIVYFLLPDGFPSQKRAELIRLCVYKLNCTGAIVTNIVMDSCPLNYATFRRLGCKLSELSWFRYWHWHKKITSEIISWRFFLSKLGKFFKSNNVHSFYFYLFQNSFKK